MKKEEIIYHYQTFSSWLESLKDISEASWLKPLSDGKWSIAAVVTHLMFWDRYSFSERFPYFQQGAKLTPFPDFQKVNDDAASYAHSGISKNEIIEELLLVRSQYTELLNQLNEEQLETAFSIGTHELTIRDYFKDFVEHDLHHKKQIEMALGRPTC